jgi:uncharacterized protein (TIGR03435 family)
MRKLLPNVMLAALIIAVIPSIAQTNSQSGKLEFEVASIKPAAPPTNGRGFVGRQGGPGTADPGRVTYTNLALRTLITTAYDVKTYQVTGPGWLDTERFDIAAKIFVGATKEQVNQMLQNLLADRFNLSFHRVTKEFRLYELVVGKNGPRMKASVEDPNAAANSPAAGGGRGSSIPMGKDGFPSLPAGRRGMIQMQMDGRRRIAGSVQSMKDLAELLGNQLGAPVVDKTGLGGTYDFTLDFALGPGRGIDALIAPGAGPADNLSDFPNFFSALQEQLGLKLEQKNGPLDVIVIDRAERVPSEN